MATVPDHTPTVSSTGTMSSTSGATASPSASTRATASNDSTSIGEVVEYVTTYAKQETLGPLRGAGRWLGYGAAGALLLGIGLLLVVLGVLRLIQTEWDRLARGSLSWGAYALALVLCGALLALVLTRINRDELNEERD